MKKKTENQIEFDKQIERLIKIKKKLLEDGYEAEGITMPQPPKIVTRKYLKQLEGITYDYLKGRFDDQEIKQQDIIPEILQKIKNPIIGIDYRGNENIFSPLYNKPIVDTNPTLLTHPLLDKRKDITETKKDTEEQEAKEINVSAGEVILENLFSIIDEAMDSYARVLFKSERTLRAEDLKSMIESTRISLGDVDFFSNLISATSERLIELCYVAIYDSDDEKASLAYYELYSLLNSTTIDNALSEELERSLIIALDNLVPWGDE